MAAHVVKSVYSGFRKCSSATLFNFQTLLLLEEKVVYRRNSGIISAYFSPTKSRQIARSINSAEEYPIQTVRQRLGEEPIEFAGYPVRAPKEAPPLQNHQPPIEGDVVLIDVAVFSECCVMYEARLILRIESGELPAVSLFERPLKIAHRIPSIPWDRSWDYFLIVCV